jgi:hypothetical protein
MTSQRWTRPSTSVQITLPRRDRLYTSFSCTVELFHPIVPQLCPCRAVPALHKTQLFPQVRPARRERAVERSGDGQYGRQWEEGLQCRLDDVARHLRFRVDGGRRVASQGRVEAGGDGGEARAESVGAGWRGCAHCRVRQ